MTESDMTVRLLELREITPALFDSFERYQEVKRCWRKEGDRWLLKDIAFIEQWDAQDYQKLCKELQEIIRQDGAVWGAFCKQELVGFAAVGRACFGSARQYVQLAELYISLPYRGKGIGRKLFGKAAQSARQFGAQKLYISAHSCEETQWFYKKMHCMEAEEYNAELVEKEPCDCQMEFRL